MIFRHSSCMFFCFAFLAALYRKDDQSYSYNYYQVVFFLDLCEHNYAISNIMSSYSKLSHIKNKNKNI